MKRNDLIIAKDCYYSMDCIKTQQNNNVLVVGTSGSGKTRSIVIPNLLQATGSYVVSDPKGRLYKDYKGYLERKGYRVVKVDFTEPENSAHYNFFHYIHNTNDIMKLAHMMLWTSEGRSLDPFWSQAGELLVSAIIGFLKDSPKSWQCNVESMMKLLRAADVDEMSPGAKTVLDRIFEEYQKRKGGAFGYRQYVKFRQAAARTMQSILITVSAQLNQIDTPEMNAMMVDDEVDIPSIGEKKTAVFVIVSDTDRSKDMIANVFFTQVMNELCLCADKRHEGKLPVDVRFILDDFATNCHIDQFPRMISSFRSRGISAMLMIQAESQLMQGYGQDGRTIMGNCDTYVYLGGGDLETAREVAARADVPMQDVLWMPVKENWVFRRGERPRHGKNFELEPFLKKRIMLDDMEEVMYTER